ncbi:MAG: hypothetical protein WA782_10815 [Sulfitobacter sp.]
MATTAVITFGVVFAPAAGASDTDKTTLAGFKRQALERLIRQELMRTGCLVGGKALGWGPSERNAAEKFLAFSGDEAPLRQPNTQLLIRLANAPENICLDGSTEELKNCFMYSGAAYCD